MGFDPISMVMLAGAGLSAASQVSGGMAVDRAAGVNARIQEGQADQIDSQTGARVGQNRRDFRKFAGQQLGDLAAHGASASGGTGLLLAQEAARQAKLDQLNLVTDGANAASAARMGAQMTRYEGKARKKQAILGGLGTAVSGVSQWYSMTQEE